MLNLEGMGWGGQGLFGKAGASSQPSPPSRTVFGFSARGSCHFCPCLPPSSPGLAPRALRPRCVVQASPPLSLLASAASPFAPTAASGTLLHTPRAAWGQFRAGSRTKLSGLNLGSAIKVTHHGWVTQASYLSSLFTPHPHPRHPRKGSRSPFLWF